MRPLTTIERVRKLLGEPDPRFTIEPKSKFKKPMDQMNVGQTVQAEAVAGAMSGTPPYKTINYPSSGDFETELINLINVFVGQGQPGFGPGSHFNQERLASVFDYLAKRFRDNAREAQRQMENWSQPSRPRIEDELQKLEMMRTAQEKQYALDRAMMATPPPARNMTATEVNEVERKMRDTMREEMLSELHKTTIR